MYMRINSELITASRIKRAWSQEHLAMVAGLGHRTVQRIENSNLASFESLMAIASVLELDVDELQQQSAEGSKAKAVWKNLPETITVSSVPELLLRLILAAVSGYLVAILLSAVMYNLSDLSITLLSGALFGLMVLCPFLQFDGKILLKASMLISGSALSFFAAVSLCSYLLSYGDFLPFIVASVVGCGILVVTCWFVSPLRLALRKWKQCLVVSIVGGIAVYGGVAYLSDYDFARIGVPVGLALWHSLITLLFFHERNRTESGNKPGSVLTDFLIWIRVQNELGKQLLRNLLENQNGKLFIKTNYHLR